MNAGITSVKCNCGIPLVELRPFHSAHTSYVDLLPMGDLVDKVFNFAPSTWRRKSLPPSTLYVLETVESYTVEYNEIMNYFSENSNGTVTLIKRVECPFIYGRFLLRKEQLTSRNGYIEVGRKIIFGKDENLKEGIETNFDNRACHGFSKYGQTNGDVAVVSKYINAYGNERDCNSYPEYVIYYVN